MGRLLVIVSAVMLLSACGHRGRAWTEEDPWYASIPFEEIDQPWHEIEFERVAPAHLADAIALVADAPTAPLDPETAATLTDGAWPADVPALAVRAVYLNDATGGFTVRAREGKLWVRHASLGARAMPMQRTVLVVALAEPPQETYVSCSMAR